MRSTPGFVSMSPDELMALVKARDICQAKLTDDPLQEDRSTALAVAASAALIALLRFSAMVPERAQQKAEEN